MNLLHALLRWIGLTPEAISKMCESDDPTPWAPEALEGETEDEYTERMRRFHEEEAYWRTIDSF